MLSDLKGNKIIVTGACGGMGRATALELAKKGTIVIAIGKSRKNLTELAGTIKSRGGICYPFVVNLENYSEIINFTKKIKKEFKSIDWLINCAGLLEDEDKAEDFLPVFKVNILAIIYLTQFLTPVLNKNGGIVNISSIAGIWFSPIFPVYSASKAALNAYSKVTAKAFSSFPKKLSCFNICPGRTNTPMRQKAASDAHLHQGPEIIARAIKNIVSGKSKFRNGDVIIIQKGRQRLYDRRA